MKQDRKCPCCDRPLKWRDYRGVPYCACGWKAKSTTDDPRDRVIEAKFNPAATPPLPFGDRP